MKNLLVMISLLLMVGFVSACGSSQSESDEAVTADVEVEADGADIDEEMLEEATEEALEDAVEDTMAEEAACGCETCEAGDDCECDGDAAGCACTDCDCETCADGGCEDCADCDCKDDCDSDCDSDDSAEGQL